MILLLMMQVTDVDIRFRVDESLVLQIETPVVDLGMIDPISKEMERSSAIMLTVFANTDWELVVKPSDDFISQNGDVIPINRLSLRVNGEDYVKMDRDGVPLLKGGTTPEEGMPVNIDLKLKLLWGDVAGSYSTTLTFTLMRL
ncbi:hypothetical protein J7J69_01645 [candidate division WOR-3 bacterium]|nr:hypothetical protein [candidate division WOR-3 bacterium]